jgi:hypothetical protein
MVTSLPTCYICNKPVELQSATADELGRAVHGGCYFLKSVAKPASSLRRAQNPSNALFRTDDSLTISEHSI